ncbi:PAS domain S-box protein [uncultured Imperialibacter sp.]|uniref:PAS domain S-box protein n=1 Tax=uncultured Imperialibacter sp. TaxID=1672639 RepID=UPI0030D76AE7
MRTSKDSLFVTYTSLATNLVAILVIAGWITGAESLLTILPGLPTMKFNTAIAFLLTGLALMFLPTSPEKIRIPSQLFSAITLVIALLTLSEYTFNYSMGIDEFFFTDQISRASNSSYPGRMSAATATCFALMAASLLIFASIRGKLLEVAQYLLHVVTILASISLVAFFYNLPVNSRLSFFSSMALHTSVCFMALSFAASIRQPHLGLINFFRGDGMGSWLARRLFPQFSLLILLLGFIRILTDRYSLISVEFGILLLTVSFLLVSLSLILRVAYTLNKVDSERQEAESQLTDLNESLEERINKRTEELTLLNERLQLATSSGKVGLWTIDLKDNFLDVNDALRKIWGFDPYEPLSPDSLSKRTHPEDQARTSKAFELAVKNRLPIGFEHRIILPDGATRYIKVNGVVHYDSQQTPLRIAGTHWDITEQKLVEISLEESDRRNRVFVAQAPSAIAMFDTEMRYLAASEKWKEDYGIKNKEIIGVSHYDIFPEIGDDWKKIHAECLRGAINKVDEAPFNRADGSVQWLAWDVRPWYKVEGVVGGLIMYTGDITSLKEKEEEKRHLESVLNQASETANIGAWEVDLVNNSVYWDRITKKIHKVDKDYVPKLDGAIQFFKEGESRQRIEAAVQNAILDGTPYDLEVELVAADGSLVWTRAVGQAEFSGGTCRRLFGVFQDIDQIKKAELNLKVSEEQFRGAFQYSAIGMALVSLDGKWLKVNSSLCKMLGYTDEELTKVTFQELTHPDDLNSDLELMAQTISGEIPSYQMEKRYFHKDGQTIWVLLNVSLIKDIDGNPSHFISQIKNISDRKASEAALKEERKLLKSLIDNIPVNIYIKDLESRKTLVNRLEMEYSGFKNESEVIGKTDFDLYPEESAKVSREEDLEVFNTGKPILSKETINTRHDGSTNWFLSSKIPMQNDRGEIVGLIGISYNITDRKLAERALQESEQRWHFALEGANEGVWDWNLATGEVFYSKRSLAMLGINPKDVPNKSETWDNRVHPEDKEAYFEEMQRHLRGESEIYINEHRVQHQNGHYVWVLDRGKITEFNQKGQPLRVIGTHSDITWRKEKEAQVRHSFDVISEQNKRLLNFAHIVSHNLRSHSGNLEMMINLINMTSTPEEKEELIQHLAQISGSLSETITNLNEVVKIQVDINTQTEELKLKEYFVKTMHILSGDIKEKKAKINLNIGDDLTVTYNAAYLESILLNFLSNAIKYRHPDRNPVVNVNFITTNNSKILQIADNGMGIDLALHGERLFGMYKTFHGNADAKGIGLFITKNQVESMGGRIEVESEVGVGTTFKIYLT